MNLKLLLYIFACTALSVPVEAHQSFDWNIGLSLIMNDNDIRFESSATIKPRSRARLSGSIDGYVELGANVEYANQELLYNLFSKIILNRYQKITDPKDSQKTIEMLSHKLNVLFDYSLSSSELSIKIAPRSYNDKNSYLKNLFFYNFLVRHYKCDAQGDWSFVGYETKDGDRSFDDFQSNNLDLSRRQSIDNLKKRLNGKKFEDVALKTCKQGAALIMTHYLNENADLKSFWTDLFASIKKNIDEA